MKKPAPRAPAEKVALYEAVVATVPGLERKGAGLPYTSINGNMFSLLTPSGALALRLNKPDREAFLKKHNTTLCEQYGSVMPEYVVVPDALLEDTKSLSKDFARSYAYASALRPKPTTRKKPTAKKSPKKKSR
jgi:hypothetical protein